ncbi:hypothetical protein [Bacillus wiedmannii]|uniref:hypothetical protein n=1 Tax=Bacillus wiedmannii TaxID=1890302 RepID=UPI0021D292F3|nr:hypothetical protein [Bacillus wiedmannii]MCU5577979.1 hypothetical protein [Bacillus wiedmannii]
MTDLPEKYSKVPTYYIMRKDVFFSDALQGFVEMIKEKLCNLILIIEDCFSAA